MHKDSSRPDFDAFNNSTSQNQISEGVVRTIADDDGDGNLAEGSITSFDSLVKTAIERQENIIYAIGEDSQLPLIEEGTNV